MSKSTARNVVALDHPINDAVDFEIAQVGTLRAAELLERNRSNRNLRQSVVQRYARDMAAGNWHMSAEPIKVDWNGRLIDGQHRLNAVIEAKVTVPMMIVWNLDPDVQIVIDAGAKRSSADAFRFKGVVRNPETLAAIARLSIAWDSGLLKNAASSVGNTLTASEAYEWVESHPEAHEAAAFASKHYKDLGMTPSALGFAAMKLLAIDEQAAIEFVASMAELRTDGATDPRAVFLRTVSRMKAERVRLTPALQLSLFFRAWNMWRSNRTTTKLPTLGARAAGIPEPK